MDLQDNFHEITQSAAPGAKQDVSHVLPYDHTDRHVWILEPPAVQGVLTQDGVTQIAFHQYKAGTYTTLDNLLNPYWTALTELLPLHMAPNLVTSTGALHCFVAYLVTWHYSPDLDQAVPDWVLVASAYCMAAYYTLDCCDGKQARRTNSSSPLGQLFDHGVDCICNLSHLSMVMASLMAGSSPWFFMTQGILQFSFFVAQWEEYYTGTLPHATGDFGVTEVNYGLAAMTLGNAFVDRNFYLKPIAEVAPKWLLQAWNDNVAGWILPVVPRLPAAVQQALLGTIQVRHVLLLVFGLGMKILIALSVTRVLVHVSSTKQRLSSVSKLFTPLLLSYAPLFLAMETIQQETRYVSLSFGLVICLITIKMIVFSMAKRAYATVQWDALPALAAVYWVRSDPRLTPVGVHAVFVCLTALYLLRIYYWTSSAITQICQRLDINLFTLKQKSA